MVRSPDTKEDEPDASVEPPLVVNEELDKRIAEIERDLKSAAMPYLQRAALVREWADKSRLRIYGHNVQKSLGRPPGEVGSILEQLSDSIPGKTTEAKRKWVERALKVASLSSDIVTAAKKAGLAERQKDLLLIANEQTEEARMAAIEKVKAASAQALHHRQDRTRKAKGKSKAIVLIPAGREIDILRKLAAFVEELGIELVPPDARAA